MKVTYIGHSGFLAEFPHSYFIFDYYNGTIPELDGEKDIFVFVSHSHPDHFNPEVFELKKKYPHVRYLFANQVKRACSRDEHRTGVKYPEITFLLTGKDAEITDGMGHEILIHALHSTDCGCAFLINYDGVTVYHAGDLHWWTWPGESAEENKKMASDYRKEIEYLKDRHIDIAFAPLDPRQEGDYALGMNYLLSNVNIRHVFPMHFWSDFSVCEKYMNENEVPERTEFHIISEEGQNFEIMF